MVVAKRFSLDPQNNSDALSKTSELKVTKSVNFDGKNYTYKDKLDYEEQRSRRHCIIVYGVDEVQNENIYKIIKTVFLDYLKVDLSEYKIVGCYRIGKRFRNRKKPRAIVVKFRTYKYKQEIYSKKKYLKGRNIYIRDYLTTQKEEVFQACIKAFGYKNVWTFDGKVYAKYKGRRLVFETIADITKETNGKVQALQLTFRNPPEDYFFMTWNWPLIRKISLWAFMSALIAMVALVVAMVSTLPKTCNPPTQWYQGSVLYEIFPASFSDSNNDGIGDLKGISLKADYLLSLGVRGVRLNSIYDSHQYPENYKQVTSLTEIAPELGNLADFEILVKSFHLRNISIILDLPFSPLITELKPDGIDVQEYNETEYNSPSIEFLKSANMIDTGIHDEITEAILFWLHHGVDGFYLKGLENHVHDKHFIASLRRWKKILGPDRPIIVNYALINSTPHTFLNIVLNNVDLIDIQVHIEDGVIEFSKQIGSILNGTLFSKAGMPWVHWNLGDVNSARLANRLPHSNATLGATLLQLMLPGTPSIFYGDEIGLKQISDPHEERKDVEHLHHLAVMAWEHPKKQFSRKRVLPWMHGHPTRSNFDQLDLISKMVALRSKSPSIYVNSVNKDGTNKANAEVKHSLNDLIVIQRWYPRRKNYVVVSNLGSSHKSGDLSTSLYGGEVVLGPRSDSRAETLMFKSISLWPGESVVVLLD